MARRKDASWQRVEILTNGWVRYHNVPGAPAWTITVLAAEVEGVPRLLGVRVEPREDIRLGEAALSHSALRGLPLDRLARAATVINSRGPIKFRSWSSMVEHLVPSSVPHRPRGGATESSHWARTVAAVFTEGQRTGQGGTVAVMTAWNVSRPTAERYIRECRQHGFLEPWTGLTTTSL